MTSPAATPILPDAIARALARIEGRPVELVHMASIADDRAATELKHIGYGEPALVRYRAGGVDKRCVLHTMAPNWFGHDRRSDSQRMQDCRGEKQSALAAPVRHPPRKGPDQSHRRDRQTRSVPWWCGLPDIARYCYA